jgi:hypothetical protein
MTPKEMRATHRTVLALLILGLTLLVGGLLGIHTSFNSSVKKLNTSFHISVLIPITPNSSAGAICPKRSSRSSRTTSLFFWKYSGASAAYDTINQPYVFPRKS